MLNLIARRNYRGNLTLNNGDVRFGTIFLRADNSISGAAFVDDDIHQIFRNLRGMPVDTIEQVLARVRRACEIALEDRQEA